MSLNAELGREKLQHSQPGQWGCVTMDTWAGDRQHPHGITRGTRHGWAAPFKGTGRDSESLNCPRVWAILWPQGKTPAWETVTATSQNPGLTAGLNEQPREGESFIHSFIQQAVNELRLCARHGLTTENKTDTALPFPRGHWSQKEDVARKQVVKMHCEPCWMECTGTWGPQRGMPHGEGASGRLPGSLEVS